jgi:hypothetical protein
MPFEDAMLLLSRRTTVGSSGCRRDVLRKGTATLPGLAIGIVAVAGKGTPLGRPLNLPVVKAS